MFPLSFQTATAINGEMCIQFSQYLLDRKALKFLFSHSGEKEPPFWISYVRNNGWYYISSMLKLQSLPRYFVRLISIVLILAYVYYASLSTLSLFFTLFVCVSMGDDINPPNTSFLTTETFYCVKFTLS